MQEIQLSELLNKSVVSFVLSDNQKELLFSSKEGDFLLMVTAECCSQSWIESINNSEDLIDATILEIEGIAMDHQWSYPDPYKVKRNHKEHDVLQYYCLKIKTSKGYVDIEFRNASNGYYGAGLELYKV